MKLDLHITFSSMCSSILLHFLICILWWVSFSANGGGGDLQALLSVKAHIVDDPSRILASWNISSYHFCNWTGVSCGRKHQRVVGLDLSGFELRGTLSASIGNLTFLKDLQLANNSLSGSIPQETTQLTRLRYLGLSNNSFTGEIPRNLSYLLEMLVINLNDNFLTGTIPVEIGSLPNLELLFISGNQLSGTIPPSIGNLSAFRSLSLSYNNLTGIIPQEFEYAVGARASTLVDVYSYGVLLLEMFSGKRPTDAMFKDDFSLHNYVKMAIPDQVMSIADPRLFAECENNPFRISGEAIRRNACEVEKGLASVFRVGVICSARSPKERMEIAHAMVKLETVRNALSKLL